jgi:hypothetical protein
MSSISVAAEECAASGQPQPVVESFPGRDTNLGQLKILRALPIRGKRLVGPWCFFACAALLRHYRRRSGCALGRNTLSA